MNYNKFDGTSKKYPLDEKIVNILNILNMLKYIYMLKNA